jgi:hypothetical protein
MSAVLVAVILVGLRILRDRPTRGMEGDATATDVVMEPARLDVRVAAVVVAAFFVTAGGLYFATDYILYMQSSVDHTYSVSIDASTNDTYSIMCPIPCDRDGSIYDRFIEEIEVVDGSADLEQIDTDHGYALKILAKGDVRIEWKASWEIDGEMFLNLTMTRELSESEAAEDDNDEITAESWIYSNVNGTSVVLQHQVKIDRATIGFFACMTGHTHSMIAMTGGEGWETVGTEYGTYET